MADAVDPADDPVGATSTVFARPVKRSVTIAGHQTAISLEPLFWEALRLAAAAADLPVNALVARIDLARMASIDPPGLATAIRCWLYDRAARSNNN
ncbi:MAG: ribbon-helix-helix domain-containing protein [Sphingobium sp.]